MPEYLSLSNFGQWQQDNRPIRQWVLSVPFPLCYLFATNPKVMSRVPTIVHRMISTFLIKRWGKTVKSGAQSGAATLIQRFGSALNLNLHFYMLYLTGIYDANGYFWPVKPPTREILTRSRIRLPNVFPGILSG